MMKHVVSCWGLGCRRIPASDKGSCPACRGRSMSGLYKGGSLMWWMGESVDVPVVAGEDHVAEGGEAFFGADLGDLGVDFLVVDG